MAYDRISGYFIPALFILCSGKSEELYVRLFREILQIVGSQWKPVSIGVDFEKGLINAVRYFFENSIIIGCLFHFKQALFRKILKLGLKKPGTNWFEVLKSMTAIALEEIVDLPESLSRIQSCLGPEWIPFFNYFHNTWTKLYPATLWNINYLKSSLDQSFICRTNNRLERYNRKLNENLSSHGNIVALLDFLKSEHRYYRTVAFAARDGDCEKISSENDATEDPILSEILSRLTG